MATLYTILTDGYGINNIGSNRVVDGYYTNTFTPVYELDSSVTNIKLAIEDSEGNLLFDSGKANLTKTQRYMYKTFDLSQAGDVQDYVSYTFRITLWKNRNSSTYTLQLVNSNNTTIDRWTRVRRPSFNNLQPVSKAGVLSPFRSENRYQFDSFLTSLNDLAEYALTGTEDSFSINAILSDGNVSCPLQTECSLNGEKLEVNLEGGQVQEACKNFNFSNNNIPEVTLTLSITNGHGAIFSSQPMEVKLPKTPVVDVSDVQFDLRFRDITNSMPDFMTKNCKLYVTGIKIKSLYQPTKLTVSLVKNQIICEYDLNDIVPDADKSFEYTVKLGELRAVSTFPDTNKFDYININNDFEGNLSKAKNTVKITVENTQNISTTQETTTIGAPARGMRDGSGEITSWSFNGDRLSLSLKMNHYGILDSMYSEEYAKTYVTFSARVYYKDLQGNWTKTKDGNSSQKGYLTNNAVINSDGVYTLSNFDMSQLGYKVQIKIVCKIRIWPLGKTSTSENATHATEYSYEIEQKELIKGGPTLSYRRNSVGINYNFPDNTFADAVLVVGAESGKNKVVFKRSGSGDNIIFDLSAGTMSGLTIEIDGGEWT